MLQNLNILTFLPLPFARILQCFHLSQSFHHAVLLYGLHTLYVVLPVIMCRLFCLSFLTCRFCCAVFLAVPFPQGLRLPILLGSFGTMLESSGIR